MKPLAKSPQTLLVFGVGIVVLVCGVILAQLYSEELSRSSPQAQPAEQAHPEGTPEEFVARGHPAPTLLSSQTIVGVAVNNAQGEKMGTIQEILLDPVSGLVQYAVVDTGGFLGFGKQQSFAVPWHAVRVHLDRTDVVVQLEQGQFPMQPALALSRR